MKNKCACEGLINAHYFGKIELYDTIHGKIMNTISQDSANYNYLTFTIHQDTLNFFKVSISFGMTGESFKGWIKKASYIATTLNDYDQPIILYSKPTDKSNVKYTIDQWTDDYFQILYCSNNWAFISFYKENILIEGWLNPTRQCNNPYTTCN